MTAFAAIVPRDGAPPDRAAVGRVAAALGELHGTVPVPLTLDGCVLLTAPLHAADSSSPFVDHLSGVAVVGQILLEDPLSLAAELRQPRPGADLALVAAAFHRWRGACTDRLNGELAFALWDPAERMLLCARDGLGLRRVYVAQAAGVTIVSNLLAAATACTDGPASLDEAALMSFLACGAMPAGRTAYAAVREFPAGHTLAWHTRRGGVSLRRHWRFPEAVAGPRRRASEILEGYRDVLSAAVGDRIRDGRASILLSGGVDSTVVAAAARTARPDAALHGYTAVYERFVAASELALARAAGERLNIPVTAVNGDAHAPFDADRGEATPQPLDEPMLSDWRDLLGAAARHGTVALYGEDGDTLLLPPALRALIGASGVAGLTRDVLTYLAAERSLPYLGLRIRERLHVRPRRIAAPLPPWLSGDGRRLLATLEVPTILGRRPEPLVPHRTRPRTQERLAAAVPASLAPLISAEVTRQPIELRCPLLDTRVLRYVAGVPPIPWCQQKRLPRAAFRDRLPAAILDRPKTGVRGLHEAQVQHWQRTARSSAGPLIAPLDAWVDDAAWRRALDSSDAGVVGLAWRVLQLGHWLRRARAAAPSRAAACTA